MPKKEIVRVEMAASQSQPVSRHRFGNLVLRSARPLGTPHGQLGKISGSKRGMFLERIKAILPRRGRRSTTC